MLPDHRLVWSSSGGAVVLFVRVFEYLFLDLTTVSPHKVKNHPFLLFLRIWNNKKRDILCDVIVGVQEIPGKFQG